MSYDDEMRKYREYYQLENQAKNEEQENDAITVLKDYAKNDTQSIHILHVIWQALEVKDFIQDHKIPNRPDKIVKSAKAQKEKLLINLKKMSISEDFLNENSELMNFLEKSEIVSLDSTSEIINKATIQFSEELISCGFTKTIVKEEILPVIMSIIKGKF